MELLSSMGNHFYGIFQAGGNFLSIYIINFIPWILLMITFMVILSRMISLSRIEKLMVSLGKNPITRWTLMPVVGMVFSGERPIDTNARFLPERQKAAFLDSSASFSHPATALFPHTNPGELFVFLGIATGVYLAGYELGFLAISYFLIGIVVILIRGLVTELIYYLKDKRKEAPHAMEAEIAPSDDFTDEFKIVILDEIEETGTETVIETLIDEEAVDNLEKQGEDKVLSKEASDGIGFAMKCRQGGREVVDLTLKEVLPSMAFYALLLGIITYTGLGDIMAESIYPYLGTLPGLLGLVVICALPVISPLLGSGALIAQVLSVLIGLGIYLGAFPVYLALPAFFAINVQVGCDTIKTDLLKNHAADETIVIGEATILFSRLITGPIAVVIAYFFALLMYGII